MLSISPWLSNLVWRQASADTFNADLLRDEPSEKVRAVLAEARAVHSL